MPTASLAIFLQHCSTGISIVGNTSEAVPQGSFELGFPENLLSTEARIPQVKTLERQRDGGGCLAAAARRDGPGLRLGTRRRLKGDWARSARILESEVEIYHGQPSVSSRLPPTVDLTMVYDDIFDIGGGAAELQLSSTSLPAALTEGLPRKPAQRQHALRALRRLRPHVLCVFLFDREPGDAEHFFLQSLLNEQLEAGPASVVIGPNGPTVATLATNGRETGFLWARHRHDPLDYRPGHHCSFCSGRHGQHHELRDHRDTLLYTIQSYVRGKDPGRFGFLQAFVTYQSPVTRLEEWDDIAKMLENSFGSPGTRPCYIDPSSEICRKIAGLFRFKLEKIQAVQTPSQRRLPHSVHRTRSLLGLQRRGQERRERPGRRSFAGEAAGYPERELGYITTEPEGVLGGMTPPKVIIEGQDKSEPGLLDIPDGRPLPLRLLRAILEIVSPESRRIPVSGLPTDVSFPGVHTGSS